MRVGRIDPVGERRRDGDGVARRNLLQRRNAIAARELCVDDIRRRAQGFSDGGTHGWPRFRGFGPLCSMPCPASKTAFAGKAWPASFGAVAQIAASVFGEPPMRPRMRVEMKNYVDGGEGILEGFGKLRID